MNEQTKQQKAIEIHAIVAELNSKIEEAESLGLTVEIHTNDTINLLSDNTISCGVYSITSLNKE